MLVTLNNGLGNNGIQFKGETVAQGWIIIHGSALFRSATTLINTIPKCYIFVKCFHYK